MEPQHAFSREGKLWTDPQWKNYHHVCVHSLHTSRNLFHGRTWDRTLCLKICWIIMVMEHCVAHLCSWIVVLSVHVCCKTCIMLRPLFQCHWSTYFHRGLPLSQLLIQTLRKIDQLPRSTEASVREWTDPRIIELIPGLQDARKRRCLKCILKIAACSEERMDVLIKSLVPTSWGCCLTHLETWWLWSCLLHVCVTVVSTSWTVPYSWLEYDRFSREMTGAIKRRVVDPPAQGSTPPNDDDPIHPDQHGDVPPNDDDDDMLSGDEPEDPLDDDNQPDYNTGPDPDDHDGPPPNDDLDMPGIQDSGETHDPSSPSTPFSSPDVPIKEIAWNCWSWTRWRSFTRTWSNFWANQNSKETETDLNWFYWCFTKGKGQGDYQEAKGSITRSCQTYFSSYSETWWWRRWRTFTWY